MTVQSNNNNLNFINLSSINRSQRFFLTLLCTKHEIKDFNVLIDGKSFFDLPVKNEEEAYEKIIEISKNNDYTTGNLLDFAYFKENYRLIAIDLSKQTKLKDPQQISFIGKLEGQDHGATMFFIIEKSEETIFEFSQNSVNIL